MRSRNIKPGFYKDEDLVECSIAARLLAPGLWMMADRAGRLEDRPKKIKMEIFPADMIDVEPLLQELHDRKHIIRYTVDGERYIFIPGFIEHQAPHHTEKQSFIPQYPGEGTGNESIEEDDFKEHSRKNASSIDDFPKALPPDSLIPDSLIPEKKENTLAGVKESSPPGEPLPLQSQKSGPEKPKKPPRASPRTKLTADFTPPDAWCEFAIKKGFLGQEAAAMFQKFKDYHLSKGSVMADWTAAWRTWVRNELEYRQRHQQRTDRKGF